jgi:glucose-6-phosphate 1-epimerase
MTAASSLVSAPVALRATRRVASSRATRRASATTPRAAASVETMQGAGGLDAVKITGGDGSVATAYLFGGVVTSFVKDGRDVLYVRPDAVFDKSKPISGGLPHCWPQFGPGDIQVHGFARNVDWALTGMKCDGDDATIEMTLTPNDYTKAMWDKEFKVTQTITVGGGEMKATMKVINAGKESFDFTGSFHAYFAADIDAVSVGGLAGCKSLDRLANEEGVVEGDVTIAGPVDSVYYDAPAKLTLAVGGGNDVSISNSGGWKDAVVWSPWTDMEACYKEFVCVEPAACGEPVTVPAGGEWEATTVLA